MSIAKYYHTTKYCYTTKAPPTYLSFRTTLIDVRYILNITHIYKFTIVPNHSCMSKQLKYEKLNKDLHPSAI